MEPLYFWPVWICVWFLLACVLRILNRRDQECALEMLSKLRENERVREIARRLTECREHVR